MKQIFGLLGIAALLIVSMVFIHEETHAQIAKEYNCETIERGLMSVSFGGCDEGVMLPQAINEVVGYNVMPYMIILVLILLSKKDGA